LSNSTNSLVQISDGIVKLVDQVSPSVVQVSAGRRGFGSGVIWDNEGKIVTSAHVVGRASNIEVTLPSGKSYTAKIIGQDMFSDVALLHVEGAENNEELQPIVLGDSSKLSTGQLVFALANPFGEKVSATFGIITNANSKIGGRMPWADNVIISDAKLNPGYSGGPLVDASGKLIGLNAAYFANRGISIPVNSLKDTVSSLSIEGSVKRAFLGVVSDAITLPQEFIDELKQEEGLIVFSVEAGTPAKKGGVAVGDIIVRLDSKPISSFGDLRRVLNSKVIGKPTTLSVLRGEKLTELTVTPSEA
jgi:S1-C subfamily serine protease